MVHMMTTTAQRLPLPATLPVVVDSWLLLLLLLLLELPYTDAFYVSYETARGYRKDESIPIWVNKLTSTATLSPIDYSELPLCFSMHSTATDVDSVPFAPIAPTSSWQGAMQSWHGDAMYELMDGGIVGLQVLREEYCASMASCLDDLDNHDDVVEAWKNAVIHQYEYNVIIDGLPAVLREEDETMTVEKYWGGIPMGRQGSRNSTILTALDESSSSTIAHNDEQIYLYNHWNIEIEYKQVGDLYYVLRVRIEPFSVQQYQHDAANTPIMASCTIDANIPRQHTHFDMLESVPLQPLLGSSKIRFTYDVRWVANNNGGDYSHRWDVFLSTDGYFASNTSLLAGWGLGVFILVALVGSVGTWVLRDLSYKPVIDLDEMELDETASKAEHGSDASGSNADPSVMTQEQQVHEMIMWPLSTRVFFPPTHAPALLCIGCGAGAQLLVAGLVVVVLFRFGIINQSQGAGLLTPGIIVYTLSSIVGGYVTARLYAIFHGTLTVALASCLCVAIAYPLCGLLTMFVVYDVLPNAQAPAYNIMSHSTPIVLVWIFVIWPLTVLGGFIGYRAGPIHNFPVSEGSVGYQDLDLQDSRDNDVDPAAENAGAVDVNETKDTRRSCFQRNRIGILLAVGGILPVLSCFVSYSYGIAGPMLRGFYSARLCSIVVYIVFALTAGSLAVLSHYRQMRSSNGYEWWWPSFAVSASSGIYIFLLSMSYILVRSSESSISAATMASYVLWFALIGLGVALSTGFVGVAMSAWFTRRMYTYILNQHIETSA